MKVYRALPYEKIRYEKQIIENHKKLEDVYYSIGYIPFDAGSTVHISNNIYKDLPKKTSEIGKYFFLFPEDAINNSDTLNYVHDIKGSNIFLAEYDIPLELVLKYIGYGDYSGALFHKKNYCLECFVSIKDLGDKIISSFDISEEIRIDAFIKSINNIIIKESNENDHLDFYKKIFDIRSLNDVKNNPNIIRKIIQNNPFLLDYLKSDVTLVKCPFITDKIIPVNCDSQIHIAELLKKYDVNADFSKEHKIYKDELLQYVGLKRQPKNKEMVRKLLKQVNYGKK